MKSMSNGRDCHGCSLDKASVTTLVLPRDVINAEVKWRQNLQRTTSGAGSGRGVGSRGGGGGGGVGPGGGGVGEVLNKK
jgi:hypothetical protein